MKTKSGFRRDVEGLMTRFRNDLQNAVWGCRDQILELPSIKKINPSTGALGWDVTSVEFVWESYHPWDIYMVYQVRVSLNEDREDPKDQGRFWLKGAVIVKVGPNDEFEIVEDSAYPFFRLPLGMGEWE